MAGIIAWFIFSTEVEIIICPGIQPHAPAGNCDKHCRLLVIVRVWRKHLDCATIVSAQKQGKTIVVIYGGSISIKGFGIFKTPVHFINITAIGGDNAENHIAIGNINGTEFVGIIFKSKQSLLRQRIVVFGAIDLLIRSFMIVAG